MLQGTRVIMNRLTSGSNSAVSTFRARTWYTPRRFQQTWKITAVAKNQLHQLPNLQSVTPDIIAESWKFW